MRQKLVIKKTSFGHIGYIEPGLFKRMLKRRNIKRPPDMYVDVKGTLKQSEGTVPKYR